MKEQQNNYRMVISDLDWTLLTNDHPMSDFAIDVVNGLKDKGIIFVIASGRPIGAFPDEINKITSARYILPTNGTRIYDTENASVLYQWNLDDEEAKEIISFIEDFGVSCEYVSNENCYMSYKSYDNLDKCMQDDYIINALRESRNIHNTKKNNKDGIQKIEGFCEDMNKRRELIGQLREKFPDITVTVSNDWNFEIAPKGSGKGTALKCLCNHLKIDLNDVIACGDNNNDIEMLKMAGLCIVPENAVDDVLAIADIVAETDVYNDGVVKELYKLFF